MELNPYHLTLPFEDYILGYYFSTQVNHQNPILLGATLYINYYGAVTSVQLHL